MSSGDDDDDDVRVHVRIHTTHTTTIFLRIYALACTTNHAIPWQFINIWHSVKVFVTSPVWDARSLQLSCCRATDSTSGKKIALHAIWTNQFSSSVRYTPRVQSIWSQSLCVCVSAILFILICFSSSFYLLLSMITFFFAHSHHDLKIADYVSKNISFVLFSFCF